MYFITKQFVSGGTQSISSCDKHYNRTLAELDILVPDKVEKVDPNVHTCMGCLKGWPYDA